ncbi:beta-ketoacyl-ACP synthase III [Mesosutterella sp. AGMB02718]|uniref:Beta-ketoacyl-[acyl-carrier-protein] synthase III n=1 Tax=Mesosutterella faecium TaxID=2925194 RepID=A0ABT7IMV1_9BURK|nr:beta-ketoacyl-ACP synthase III [Mesosutterella sp. AGMB02718]MDL2059280.1 beta-ketoacyl-ACP synthase III [Mesosutterella sp. AGMB02718]
MTEPTLFSRIAGTGSALPARRVTNDELAAELAARGIETSDEWIRTRTGIAERRIVSEGETTHTLALEASRNALQAASCSPSDIDLVIVATTTPDELFPSEACRLQASLGIPPCGCFDLQAVCSGFVYALITADSLIRSGAARRALVAGADTFSRLLDWNDRSSCVLFGDGAGAVVLEAGAEPGLAAGVLVADGSRGDILRVPGRIEGGRLRGSGFLYMEGRAVFREAVESLESTAREALARAGLSAADIDCYIPHQANIRIMTHVAGRLGIPLERMETAVTHHGNTCAASVPLALDEAVRSGRLRRGQTALLQGVGAGMTCAAALLRY